MSDVISEEELIRRRKEKEKQKQRKPWMDQGSLSKEDFVGYMPMHKFIFKPTRDIWPASSVNARIPPVKISIPLLGDMYIPPSQWIDQHQPVEQLTWMPGEAMLIKDRIVAEGGFIPHPGLTVFNLYRPPDCQPGKAELAGPWLDHVKLVYPDDCNHILKWLAWRVQRPDVKINHALLLGGAPGVGKDTILYPVSYAVGSWNFEEVSPVQLLGRFNGFVKSVIMRINEARDLGDINRYTFYEHLKTIIAAPPETLRVDEKSIREYRVPNVVGVIITSNYKTDGVFLPPDDRRHYVAWSPLAAGALDISYFEELYRWLDAEGNAHVAAWLRTASLTGFDPKASPPKTPAFFEIVEANRSSDDSELADVLDDMAESAGDGLHPAIITLVMLAEAALAMGNGKLGDLLQDKSQHRNVPKVLERVGYSLVPNPDARDQLWRIMGKRQAVYGNMRFTRAEQYRQVRDFVRESAKK